MILIKNLTLYIVFLLKYITHTVQQRGYSYSANDNE